MTRRTRRRMLNAPGVSAFQITDPYGGDCESCGFPMERGDWGRWDDRYEILTCSHLCAQKARARLLRELAEWEHQQRCEAKRPLTFAHDADLFDGVAS